MVGCVTTPNVRLSSSVRSEQSSHISARYFTASIISAQTNERSARNKRQSGAHKVPTDSLYSLAESIFVDTNAITAANFFICPTRIGTRGLPADPYAVFVQFNLRLAMNERWTGKNDDR